MQSHRIPLYYTLNETNIAPEHGWLENYFPFADAYFQVLSLMKYIHCGESRWRNSQNVV